MKSPVGIDDLNLYASTLSIDFAEIANKRGFDKKLLEQTQFKRRSLLPPFEDPVTLAVNAAKPIVDLVGPNRFDLLIVATESGLDYGKPLSSYVHKYLNLPGSCPNFEIKHACYAGTAGIQMATSWLAGRQAIGNDKKALVIMTDIARRAFGKSWEMSAGSAAVAVSLSFNPGVSEIELESGYAAHEVYDSARPSATVECINPILSLGSYLDLMESAWRDYRTLTQGSILEKHMSYMVFHTPVVNLVQQAHRLLLESEGQDVSEEDARVSFERMVSPSLRYNKELGNVYSASLYAALGGLIDSISGVEAGTRVGLCSYGSGACAQVFSILLKAQAKEIVGQRQIGEGLAKRRSLSFSEYELAELAMEENIVAENYSPNWNLFPGHYETAYNGKDLLVLEKVVDYHRHYRWS